VDNHSELTGQTAQTRKQDPRTPPRAATGRARRLIGLTIGEVRRLFNLIGNDDQAIYLGLRWSVWRREHQADARACHFRRRLRLQTMQI
jgi:hypothetical protein